MRILSITKKCSLCGRQLSRWKNCGNYNNSLALTSLSYYSTQGQHYNSKLSQEPPYLYCNIADTARRPLSPLLSPYLQPKEIVSFNTSQQNLILYNSNCNRNFYNNTKLVHFVKSESHLALFSAPKETTPPQLINDDLPSPSQLSFVLLKLREELPQFFSGHHSYQTLYRENVHFENKLMAVALSVKGRSNYRMCLSSLHCLLWVINSNLSLQLIKITKNVETGQIEARWRITGKQRYSFPWSGKRVQVEGFSTFTVDKTGKIKHHLMDKVMPLPKHKIWIQSFFIRLRGLVLKPATLQTNATTITNT